MDMDKVKKTISKQYNVWLPENNEINQYISKQLKNTYRDALSSKHVYNISTFKTTKIVKTFRTFVRFYARRDSVILISI